MQSEFIRNETRPLLIKRRMSLARRLFECVLSETHLFQCSICSFKSSSHAHTEDALSKSKPPLLQALLQCTGDGVCVSMSTKIVSVADIDDFQTLHSNYGH